MKLSERVRQAAMLLSRFDQDHPITKNTYVLVGDVAGLEEALAEYENDETARRRADAYRMREMAREIGIIQGQKTILLELLDKAVNRI